MLAKIHLRDDGLYDPDVYRQIKSDFWWTFRLYGANDARGAIGELRERYGKGVDIYIRRFNIDVEKMQRPACLRKLLQRREANSDFHMLRFQIGLWEKLWSVRSKFGKDREVIDEALQTMYKVAADVLGEIVREMSYPPNPRDWYDDSPVEEFLSLLPKARGTRLERCMRKLGLGYRATEGLLDHESKFLEEFIRKPAEDDPMDRYFYLTAEKAEKQKPPAVDTVKENADADDR